MMKINSFKKLLSIIALCILPMFACSNSDNNQGGGGNNNDEPTSEVEININTALTGDLIPEDFSGLSVETGSIRINNAHYNGYFLVGKMHKLCKFLKIWD